MPFGEVLRDPDWHAHVKEFHEAMLIPVGSKPSPLSLDRLKLRLKLFDEFIELLEASGMHESVVGTLKKQINWAVDALTPNHADKQDVTEMADALGDIVVVSFGMAIEMGVDLNRVLAEIMRANMSKLDENGKPLVNVCPKGGKECPRDEHLPDSTQPRGKVLKASGYRGPDIKAVLDSQDPL